MSASISIRVARWRARQHSASRAGRVAAIVLGTAVLGVVALWISGAVLALSTGVPFGNLSDTVTLGTWSAYRAAPAYRAQAGETAQVAGAVWFVAAVALAWRWRPQRAAHGSARFATCAEARDAGLLKGNGVVLGRAWGRYLTSPAGMSVVMIARTGAEKDVSVLVPTLASYGGSSAVFDPKVELWSLTSGVRRRGGQQVYRFDPFSRTTHRLNIFDVLPAAPRAERQAAVLVLAASYYVGGGNDDIWKPLARSYFFAISGMIDETPSLHLSLGEVYRQGVGARGSPRAHIQEIIDRRNTRVRTVEKDGKTIELRDEIDETTWDGEGDPPLSRPVTDALRAFAEIKSDRMADSIINTFAAPLAIWSNPIVDAATAASDFDIRDLPLGRMSLYITVPTNRITAAAPVLGPLVTQIIDTLTDIHPDRDTRKRSPVPTMLMLNELAQLRYQPQIELASSIVRGYDAFIVSVIQSLGQIRKPPSEGGYGQHGAQTFIENHPIQVVFTPESQEAAKALAEDIGEETVTATTRSEGGDSILSARTRESDSERGRALLLPQELRAAGRDAVFIHAPYMPIGLVRKVRYYATRDLVGRLVEIAPEIAPRWPWRRPTHMAIRKAVAAGRLEAPVPVLDLAMHEARISRRIRRATPEQDGAREITVGEIAAPLERVARAEDARPETIKATARAVLDVLEEGAAALGEIEKADKAENNDG